MRFLFLTVLVLFPASSVMGAIVYSGTQNLTVSWNDLEGIYVNLADGTTGNPSAAEFDEAPWVNLTLGGYNFFNSELVKPVATSNGVTYDPELPTDFYLNLAEGTVLDSSSNFSDEAWASIYHVGTTGNPNQFVQGQSGFIGFQFQKEKDGDIYYGWLRFIPENTSVGTLVDWAVSDTAGEAITVGAVPEPTITAITFISAGALICTRRRPRKC